MALDNKNKSRLVTFLTGHYLLVSLLLAVAILIGSFYLLLMPKYREITQGGSYNLEAQQKILADKQSYLSQSEQLVTKYRGLNSKELARVKDLLPGDAQIAALFVQIEALAMQNEFLVSGITINDVPEAAKQPAAAAAAPSGGDMADDLDGGSPTAENKSSANPLKKMNVSLNLTSAKKGDYQQLKGFLATLENNLRLFDITAVYFTADSASYKVDFYTYYYQSK